MMSRHVLVALAALVLVANHVAALKTSVSMASRANPIRRVVTMLQMMQKKVEKEGETEEDLFNKFMCYCANGGKSLDQSIKDAETKIPQVESDLDGAAQVIAQLKTDIPKEEKERDVAKAAMAEAKAIREKDAAAFAKESADYKANIDSMTKAIAALEAGVGGGFLQTSAAAQLRKLVSNVEMDEDERSTVGSFLSAQQSDEYAPQSGQIIGILKQMKDTMSTELADATEQEETAIRDYNTLVAAKTKEVNALQKSIEEKMTRLGKMGVDQVNMAEDLEDTKKALAADKVFLADLGKSCATKKGEWEERSKTRSEELVALSDTIKLLNDDDSLDLFKKTLPSSSFLQMQVTSKQVAREARKVLRPSRWGDRRIDLISMALHGHAVNFAKVTAMIDDMVALLGREQVEDENKKVYCAKEFDETEDEQKSLERSHSRLETSIADSKGALDTLIEEIAKLKADIKDCDKEVAEATALRQTENAEYKDTMAADNAAIEIIGIAKNRMNKFYNPRLHKAAPKVELSAGERIAVSEGGTASPTPAPGGIAGTGVTYIQDSDQDSDQDQDSETSFLQMTARESDTVDPGAAPATWSGNVKKSGEATGAIAMMDLLVKDLAKDVAERETTEKDSQADYEQFMKDSAVKRAEDSKMLSEKVSVEADTQALLAKGKEEAKAKKAELMANAKYMYGLHQECDWLIQNYDVRKEARAGEVDALTNAKAVLSGADYSLVQTAHSTHRVGPRA